MDGSVIGAIVLACAGVVLLLHHGWKHSMDDPKTSHAQAESCMCVCYFQPKDVSHFETWILVCLTNALSIGLRALLQSDVHAVPASCTLVIATTLCAVGGLLVMMSVCWAILSGGSGLSVLLHNVSNHETWIVVCFTNALSLMLSQLVSLSECHLV